MVALQTMVTFGRSGFLNPSIRKTLGTISHSKRQCSHLSLQVPLILALYVLSTRGTADRRQVRSQVMRSSAVRSCGRASVPPQGKAPFGSASPVVSRAAPGEAFPNVCFVTGFTCEAGPEAIGGLHRQGEAMKSWLHAAYTSI